MLFKLVSIQNQEDHAGIVKRWILVWDQQFEIVLAFNAIVILSRSLLSYLIWSTKFNTGEFYKKMANV
jgi:hypothetical protein